ncbi:MAG: hypothetical protein ABIF77_13420 [bacterium]
MSEQETTPTTPRSARRHHVYGWVFVELLVVFGGVYGAFLLNEFQVNKRVEARTRQIHCALARELAEIVVGGRQGLPMMRAAFDAWLAEYRRGERPAPLFLERGGVHRPSTAIWDASLMSGAAETLDIPILHRLSEFYHALQVLLEKNDALYAFACSHILPTEDSGVATYYQGDTPNLKGHYREYMETQGEIISSGQNLMKSGEGLLDELRRLCGDESGLTGNSEEEDS